MTNDRAVDLTTASLGFYQDIPVPTYDRGTLRPSIVHIGVGGFHRAHLATYVHELCGAGNTSWSIVGCGTMPGDARILSTLAKQDGLYTLITRGPEATHIEVIGSIVKLLNAAEDPNAFVEQIANPETQIISLTVTEGGYPIDDSTHQFMPGSPNAAPGSAFGLIARGLDERRKRNGPPLTVLSCDNIMSNGVAAATATLGAAALIDPALVDWIKASISFPNSMVDRITPATAPADIEWLANECGIADGWPVVTEPFRQWVIEDNFAGDRPPLDQLDIIVTDDVEPYEILKLRLLNAGHSCMAYLAALDGIQTVDAAMADPAITQFLGSFLHQEAQPVLDTVEGIDTDSYIATLLDRFSNPHIGDQISRLCQDGSAKFPKFLMPTIRKQLAVGGPVALSALALAGWCEYLNGRDSHGNDITVSSDPGLETAVHYAELSKADPLAFLGFAEVFGSDVASAPRFTNVFAHAVLLLRSAGVGAAIKTVVTDGVE